MLLKILKKKKNTVYKIVCSCRVIKYTWTHEISVPDGSTELFFLGTFCARVEFCVQ